MNDRYQSDASPRWLHALAVLTVGVFALPLLFLGAAVTSHDVGMVDPVGFRSPLVIVRGLLENNGLGWTLEYGHRTFGFIVGFCGIGLALGCWFARPKQWLGCLGFLALALICVQGLLGIFRVDYNALHGRTYALVHGGFAHVVFAVLVCLALLTSRRWALDRSEPSPPRSVQLWSIITAALVFVQLVLGGLVRHQQDSLLGPRGHLLGAFVVTGALVSLLFIIRDSESRERFRLARLVLKTLLVVQLVLGVESWLAKFPVPQLEPWFLAGEWTRTLHYLAGTMLFSTTVVIAVIANRQPVQDHARSRQAAGLCDIPQPVGCGRFEEAAR